jgi:hypothetical protein
MMPSLDGGADYDAAELTAADAARRVPAGA